MPDQEEDDRTERERFLADWGVRESDVLEDDKGEYIMVEPELMDDGDEPEGGKFRKIYLE